MLISREEMTYDFGGACFDLEADREVLGWIFSQFLYGEVTGVQVGRWLDQAPTFEAAQFLARQANEEMTHVKVFLRVLDSLGVAPQPAHRVLKFLATDFAGATFTEHCFIDMAMGEGLALTAIYGLIDSLPESQARTLLRGLARQEEGHVSFGEQQTAVALQRSPSQGKHLLGLALVSLAAVERLASSAQSRYGQHPVLRQLPGFAEHTRRVAELRMRRLGIIHDSIRSFTRMERGLLMGQSVVRRYGRALNPLRAKPPTLTDRYLRDPAIRARD